VSRSAPSRPRPQGRRLRPLRARRRTFVVAYDVSDDSRRRRIHKLLLDFGVPVQYSVFECRLSRAEGLRLNTLLSRLIKPNEDHVRIYRLCAACEDQAERLAGPPARVSHTLVL